MHFLIISLALFVLFLRPLSLDSEIEVLSGKLEVVELLGVHVHNRAGLCNFLSLHGRRRHA